MLTLSEGEQVDLQAYLGEARRLALDEIRRFVPQDHQCGPVLYDLMLDYPLRDAKGLRPALCIAASRALGGGLEAVLPSAAVLELYHNAFLIHDDVEDGSEERRDRPTLHCLHGNSVAINVGDGMLALAMQPLLDNMRVVGLGKALRIMQTIARMARETAEGQAIELDWIRANRWTLSDAEYAGMVLKKTGWYSFIAPVVIGAIVAGAGAAQQDALVDMAHELAIAFQIRDDVLNLGAAGPYGKETNGDLWEGKRTLILIHMLRTVEATDREAACKILQRPRRSPPRAWSALLDSLQADGDLTASGRERLDDARYAAAKSDGDIDQLLAWIEASGSIEYARAVGETHADRAQTALARAELRRSNHHDMLQRLVAFTTNREH